MMSNLLLYGCFVLGSETTVVASLIYIPIDTDYKNTCLICDSGGNRTLSPYFLLASLFFTSKSLTYYGSPLD